MVDVRGWEKHGGGNRHTQVFGERGCFALNGLVFLGKSNTSNISSLLPSPPGGLAGSACVVNREIKSASNSTNVPLV